MRVLLANPNTSHAMADVIAAEARRVAAPGTEIDVCSAGFGSPYISTRTEAALAGHALLASLAENFDGHDAIIVGAFIVPAVSAAAKEAMPVPLVATGEVGLAAASLLGERFSILSIGPPARKMTDELVAATGLGGRLASIRTLSMSGTELTERQPDADRMAIELGRAAAAEDLADVLVLGAGSLEGMARRIQPALPIPVVSPVGFAVGLVETIVRLDVPKPATGTYALPSTGPLQGVAAALEAVARRR